MYSRIIKPEIIRHLSLLMEKFTKSVTPKLKALGIYQIIGGIIGLGLTAWIVINLDVISIFLLLIILVAVGLYFYSIYSGILLLKNKTNGLSHSLINQALQLFGFSVLGFGFRYASGVYAGVTIDLTNSFDLFFDFGISSWQITINSETETFFISFNLVPLFVILFIENLRKKIKKLQFEEKLKSIGE